MLLAESQKVKYLDFFLFISILGDILKYNIQNYVETSIQTAYIPIVECGHRFWGRNILM